VTVVTLCVLIPGLFRPPAVVSVPESIDHSLEDLMRLLTKAPFLATTFLAMTSCAGTVSAWKNDPLQSYKVAGPSIYAMTGDRRTAVFTRKDKDGPLRFCAESMPDAISVFTGSSAVNVKAEGITKSLGVEAGFTDTSAAGVLQTFQRTEIAEVLRQLGWNTCLAWAQGAITEPEYYGLLDKVVTGSIDVMKTRSTQTQVLQTIPSTSMIVSTTRPDPSPSPAPTPTPKPTPTPTATAAATPRP
jgi:hypothetical protein